MINIAKLKAVVFDFDDTLCVHTNHTPVDPVEFYKRADNPQYFDEVGCEVNKQLKEFVQFLKESHVSMGLCSATHFFPVMQAKQQWVTNRYDAEMENLCIGGEDNKNAALEYYAALLGLRSEEVMLVDDYWVQIEAASKAGFQVATPLEIVNFMNGLEV